MPMQPPLCPACLCCSLSTAAAAAGWRHRRAVHRSIAGLRGIRAKPFITDACTHSDTHACLPPPAALTRYHPIRHISKVKAPLLFIAGLQDELTPAYLIVKGLQQASASARTSFTAKPGATHVSLYQHPDVVPDMLAFLQLLGLASEEELAAGAARQSAAVMDKVLVEEPVP